MKSLLKITIAILEATARTLDGCSFKLDGYALQLRATLHDIQQ